MRGPTQPERHVRRWRIALVILTLAICGIYWWADLQREGALLPLSVAFGVASLIALALAALAPHLRRVFDDTFARTFGIAMRIVGVLCLVASSAFAIVRHLSTPLPWARSPATLDQVVGVLLYVLPLLILIAVILSGLILLTELVRSDAFGPPAK